MLKCLRSGLDMLWRSEAGIALPMALTVTTLGLGLGSVAAVSAINAQSGGLRDQETKTALAALNAELERRIEERTRDPGAVRYSYQARVILAILGGRLEVGPFSELLHSL
jgi:C4-dicarboxylate-specific signal transduction histidine kinase